MILKSMRLIKACFFRKELYQNGACVSKNKLPQHIEMTQDCV